VPKDKPDGWDDAPEGTRGDAVVDQQTERHYYMADGKRYWFDLSQPTWKQKNSVMSDCLKITDDGADLRLDEYYIDMMELMIEDSSLDVDSLRMFLVGMDDSLGSLLEEDIPDPSGGLAEGEEGKSDPPSGADTPDGNRTQP